MGILQTSVSGMKAQANRLGAVSQNIANVSTVGYKRASTEFSSLVLAASKSTHNGGGVQTHVRNAIGEAGGFQGTSSTTDLAINGNGFFIVEDSRGQRFLTRAGSFVPDNEGNLVNSAGFYLLGHQLVNDDINPSLTLNSLEGLARVNVNAVSMRAAPSTQGVFSANLDERAATVVPAAGPPAVALPGANTADSVFTSKSSLVTYDNLGGPVTLDIYLTKTGPNAWEIAVFNQADAGPGGGFPYGASGSAPLHTSNMTFGAFGELTSAQTLNLNVPGGQQFTLDVSGLTQLKKEFTPLVADANGNAPGAVSAVSVSENGVVSLAMEDGGVKNAYRIAIANVPSPDRMTVVSGDVFRANLESGQVFVGFPSTGVLGTIASSTLEASNVDLADELSTMIEAQRNYTANSKVFQTGSDILDVLVNLKR